MPHISHVYVLSPVYIYSFYTHYNSCTQLTGRSSHNSGLQLGLFRLLCAVLQVSDLYVEVSFGPPKQLGREMKSLGWFFASSCPGCPWVPQGASRVCMSPTMGHILGTRRLKGDACFSYSRHKKQATSLRTGGRSLEICGAVASARWKGKTGWDLSDFKTWLNIESSPVLHESTENQKTGTSNFQQEVNMALKHFDIDVLLNLESLGFAHTPKHLKRNNQKSQDIPYFKHFDSLNKKW